MFELVFAKVHFQETIFLLSPVTRQRQERISIWEKDFCSTRDSFLSAPAIWSAISKTALTNWIAYYTVDGRLSYAYKGLKAFVGVNNLFNRKYDEFGSFVGGTQFFSPSPRAQLAGRGFVYLLEEAPGKPDNIFGKIKEWLKNS